LKSSQTFSKFFSDLYSFSCATDESASLLIPRFHPLSHSDSALACSHCDFRSQVHQSDVGSYRIRSSDKIRSDFRETESCRNPTVGSSPNSDNIQRSDLISVQMSGCNQIPRISLWFLWTIKAASYVSQQVPFEIYSCFPAKLYEFESLKFDVLVRNFWSAVVKKYLFHHHYVCYRLI
jgi:hypothetical protein